MLTVAEACPDPYGHTRLHSMREQTWRAPAEHSGGCPWCGGETPASQLAAEARQYDWRQKP